MSSACQFCQTCRANSDALTNTVSSWIGITLVWRKKHIALTCLFYILAMVINAQIVLFIVSYFRYICLWFEVNWTVVQTRFAEREMQTEQKKVVTHSDRRDLRRQVLNMLCCPSLYTSSWYRYIGVRLLYSTPCLKKKHSKLFSSEFRQISTNFDNFWHKDGQDNRIV